MRKIYTTFFSLLFCSAITAQEFLLFDNYDGATETVTSGAATVNDGIIIGLKDLDIVNNFFTQGFTEIYMFAGLDTENGTFDGAPMQTDLANQLELGIIDSNANTPANTYTGFINLSELFTNVADGTEVYGVNLKFQNANADGGNNETVELYIDLVDAELRGMTLGTPNAIANTFDVKYFNNSLNIANYQGSVNISAYDLNGRELVRTEATVSSNTQLQLDLPSQQIVILQVYTDLGIRKTLKVITQ
ncbi:hypothetical protein Q2T40_08425 [Winogradskyella maritima]|uniref:Secreted protein (Por secretion system target) n=1 Tax=Winogradskyella maritima TaxID=1517766 RepID=A0ABV8ALL3_9FLAO|nr:hypothetical protein [Winogradskyella maritima]